jgi:predicted permease
LAFGPAVLARAAVVFVLVTISNYGTGVFVASSGRKSIGEALINITRVPAVYAAALGLIINFTGAQLPPLLAGPVERVSLAAVPMMLILLGLQLAQSSAISQLRLVSVGVMMRLLVSPFIALGIALLLSFNDTAMVAFIMQASMPTAVMTIILATEYDLNRQLSLSLVMASTLLSPITLSLLIFILRRLIPSVAV